MDSSPALGARVTPEGVRFAAWSERAARLWVCLFDEADRETDRLPLEPVGDGVHAGLVAGAVPGTRYGLRADGPYHPEKGLWFDPEKLLVDPYAVRLDRPFAWDAGLALPRASAVDTAPLVPKAVVESLPPPLPAAPPLFRAGGLIYEVAVRAFTRLHPEIPEAERGTIGALAHPAILEHLTRLKVDAVELMPITAWIDERHLAELGLRNAWGYNPVVYMAPDPRLCPGGLAELRRTVAALREAGIGTLLDVVFNHTGEGDARGPTLSLRGLDSRAYFRHDAEGALLNESGTGNTLDCFHPATRRLVLDALRLFVTRAGVDGFRFDLAPVLGRGPAGFDPQAPLIREILADPLLGDRVLIAEPWDIGPDGYQLGRFPPPFLEWNDHYRDRVRRFWRGNPHALGPFATALAGSSDLYGVHASRSVNFIAAHDGFALADVVAYAQKHNQANGEQNRDGHGSNHSWNHGVEGPSADPQVRAARARDLRALLATLFASRGSIMLTAGDEFGRTQSGNNNAYAQDNAITWLDWGARDRELEDHCAALAAIRRAWPEIADPMPRTGRWDTCGVPDLVWLSPDGVALTHEDWQRRPGAAFAMVLCTARGGRVAVLFNPGPDDARFALPCRPGWAWEGLPEVASRAVRFVAEGPRGQPPLEMAAAGG